MEPYVSPLSIAFVDIAPFLMEITPFFGDPYEEATAARELKKLKHVCMNFARYHSNFAWLNALLNLTDEIQMQALECGLI